MHCYFSDFWRPSHFQTSVARFDFSWGNAEFHQETLENLKKAIKNTQKLCAVSLPILNAVHLDAL